MSTITTRAAKGSPLTNNEMDTNLTNLNTDKLEINAALGTPVSATLTNATGLPLTTGVTGTLAVVNGGTGVTTPSIVAGTNIAVTGTWPNQTIATTSDAVTLTGAQTLTNKTLQAYKEKIINPGTVSTNSNIDLSQGNLFDITLGANVTFTFTNPPSATFSQPVTIVLRQDSTGNRSATFTSAKYTDGLLPPLSTGANQIDVLTFFTVDAGTSYFGTLALANVS
jgi:hypothetical protein